MDLSCPICTKRILRHARKIDCSCCYRTYHLKCLTLVPTELVTLLEDPNWICKLCLNDLFPFNHIENEKEFIASIDDTDPISSLLNSGIVFEPFETEEISQLSPLYDVDIDLHYYNSTHSLLNRVYLLWQKIAEWCRQCISTYLYTRWQEILIMSS